VYQTRNVRRICCPRISHSVLKHWSSNSAPIWVFQLRSRCAHPVLILTCITPRQPEEDYSNNARDIEVTFCDLKADVSAGDVVYIGGGRFEWDSWACLLPQNVARYSEGFGESRRVLEGLDIVYQVSLLGDAKHSLGDAESSLGDAKSSLSDAESSLGDAESSLGDA
jgi:hypothetical protein